MKTAWKPRLRTAGCTLHTQRLSVAGRNSAADRWSVAGRNSAADRLSVADRKPPPPTGQQNTVFCRPDTATEATTALLEIGHLYALYGKVIIAIVYRELELFALLVVIQFLSER